MVMVFSLKIMVLLVYQLLPVFCIGLAMKMGAQPQESTQVITNKCWFHLKSRCDQRIPEDKELCQSQVEHCELNRGDSPILFFCFAAWNHTLAKPNGTELYAGCWSGTKEHVQKCRTHICQAEIVPMQLKPGFCCCHGDLCNKAYSHVYIEKPVLRTTTPAVQVYTQRAVAEEVVIIVATVLVVVAMVVIVFVAWFLRRKYASGTGLLESPRHSAMDNTHGISSLHPLLSTERIDLESVQARGRYGAVWKATMGDDQSRVAVKIFAPQERISWLTEQDVYSLPRMQDHPNILHFITARSTGQGIEEELWIVTEFHAHGSLYDYICDHTVSWQEVLHIAVTMMRGLSFLHEYIPGPGGSLTSANNATSTAATAPSVSLCTASNSATYAHAVAPNKPKPIIAHRDFKSKNVLLKSDLTACIADFGLAITFEPGRGPGDLHGQVGTRRYMAPEVLEGAINFSSSAFLKIDVYACALVLWELLSRCSAAGEPVMNYHLPFEAELGKAPTIDAMQAVAQERLRPKIPAALRSASSGISHFCTTVEEAWDHDSEARLSAGCIEERLTTLIAQVSPPVQIP